MRALPRLHHWKTAVGSCLFDFKGLLETCPLFGYVKCQKYNHFGWSTMIADLQQIWTV
jgi:hypothetical protein